MLRIKAIQLTKRKVQSCLWLLPCLIILAVACRANTPLSMTTAVTNTSTIPTTQNQPSPLPTPGEWEPPADTSAVLSLSIRDFQSNIAQDSAVPSPLMPLSTLRGPALALEVSGLAPAGEPQDQQPDAYYEQVVELTRLLQEGLSLVKVEDGQNLPVEFDIREGWYDIDGRGPDPKFISRPAYSVVPRQSLAEGWYVLRADLSAARQLGIHQPHLLGTRRGDVLHARIYLGSRSMWSHLFVQCRSLANEQAASGDRSCVFDFRLTEAISPEQFLQDSGSIKVRYGKEAVACVTIDEAHPAGELSLQVICPEPPLGTQVEVVLDSQNYPDPLGHVGRPLQFVFDEETFRNTAGDETPILEVLLAPFDDFGLE